MTTEGEKVNFTIGDLVVTQKEIHDLAVEKGWWESWPDPMGRFTTSVALWHSEASEALEEWRDGHEGTEVYYEFDYVNPYYPATTSKEPTRLIEGAFVDDNWTQKGKPCGIPIEMADLVIRLRDNAEAMGFNLEEMIKLKHEFNKTRPYMHGGKRA